MLKYLFLISGDLGKQANFLIKSEDKISLIQAKRKIRLNFKYFLSHVSLQYHYAEVTKFSLLRILTTRLAKDLILFPKLVLTFLLFRYQIVFEPSHKQMPFPDLIYLNKGQHSPLWASRQCQVKGFPCWTSDQDLEWDMFRGDSSKAYLLDIQIQSKGNTSDYTINRPNSKIFIKRIDTPRVGTLNVLNLKNISVDRTQLHLKDGIAYPAHYFDYIEKVSIPTPLISSSQEGNIVYTTPRFVTLDVPQVISIPYSENWYHFVVEGLGALLSQEASTLNTPVLIRHTCPRNIRQILKYLTGHDPIPIDSRSSLNVENLTLIQEWRYEKRFDFQSRAEDLYIIRDSLLQLLRSRLDQIYSPQITHHNPSDVVFLARPTGLYRKMENYNESIHLLNQSGVTVIEPSSMNFIESCQIINNAKILIAETGAAMTNIILCNRDVRIVEINPEGFESDFWRGLSRIYSFGHHCISAPQKKGTLQQKFFFPTEEIRQYLLASS